MRQMSTANERALTGYTIIQRITTKLPREARLQHAYIHTHARTRACMQTQTQTRTHAHMRAHGCNCAFMHAAHG